MFDRDNTSFFGVKEARAGDSEASARALCFISLPEIVK